VSTAYPVRPFRSTVIASKVLTAGTAYGTTAVHSVVSYAAAGSITTTQFDPTVQSGTTTSANRVPPSVGGAKTDWGWRDNPAVSASEGIQVPAGTWTVTIRYLRSGVTLEAAIDGVFTVVAYRVTSAGTQVAEIGRGSSAIVSSIATTAASTTVPISGANTIFNPDDRVQYEVYFQSYLLGSPTAPAAQTNIWVNFEGASGNTCELTSAPAYSQYLFRSHATTTTPTVAATRKITAARSFATTTTPTVAKAQALTAARSFATTTTPTVARGPFTIDLKDSRLAVTTTPTPAMAKVPGKRAVVTTTPTVALRRALTKIPYAVTTTPTVTLGRALIAARTFAVTTTPTPRLRLDIPEVALDRIVVGGPADYSGSSPTKSISGIVRDSTGTPYVGATVKLIRESDGYVAATTTSTTGGAYTFTRDAADPNTYYVVAYEDTGTPTQGISARALTPV
jgi:hypothetical protein